MRRFVLSLGAIALTIAGLSFSASTASATPAPNAAQLQSVPGVWSFTGDRYAANWDCEFAGQNGMASGQWLNYDCREVQWDGTKWELWVFIN
jgi:invasion protein IalB